MIQNFAASYQNEAWIPYCINCLVIRDESLSVFEPAVILANLLSTDVASAIAVDAGGSLDFSGLSGAVSAFANAGSGTESLRAVSSELLQVQSGTRAQIAVVEQQLPGSALEELSVGDAPTVMSKATNAVEQISRLNIINAYLGRASVNISNQIGAA